MIFPREAQTSAAVAEHYDELDLFYREIWGDHVHHGYWATGRETPEEAVEALVAHLAGKLSLRPGQRICDIGCGYGATAEWLATHHGVHVTGLTISGAQAQRAAERSARLPLLAFHRQDWLENTFEDSVFDGVISIESSEHMPDKQRFFDEAYRTLRPGGQLAVYAWLARPGARAWEVRYLLEPICREGRLPAMHTAREYGALLRAADLQVTDFADQSRRVSRTWPICLRRTAARLARDPEARAFLLSSRNPDRIFALTMLRILAAYGTRAMVYGIFAARRP